MALDADSCMPGVTCWYRSAVKDVEVCPSRSDTTFRGTPEESASTAIV